jgi:5-methylcytosine-specific restriction endonuclease McrA
MTFKQAAEVRWQELFNAEWGSCEKCGATIQHGVVPHHIKAAGLGGKRDHSPSNLRYECADCHRREHS